MIVRKKNESNEQSYAEQNTTYSLLQETKLKLKNII